MTNAAKNSQTQEELFDRLGKMLRLANTANGTTEEESRNAAAMAMRMLQEYNLHHGTKYAVEDIATGARPVEDPYTQATQELGGQRPWRRLLIQVVANNMFCKAIGVGKGMVALVGKQYNIRAATELYQFIVPQMEALARVAYYDPNTPFLTNNRTWKEAFFRGLVDKLDIRLQEQAAAFAAESNACMALITTSETELADAMCSLFPHQVTKVYARPGDKAYRYGFEEGDNLRLSHELSA